MYNLFSLLPSITTLMSVLASAAATFLFIRSTARQFLPAEISAYLDQRFKDLIARIYSELTFVIEEFDDGLNKNKLFKAARVYLETKIPPSVNRIKISLAEKEKKVSLSVEKNEEIVDFFNGVQIKWKFQTKPASGSASQHDLFRLRSGSSGLGNGVYKSQVPCFEVRFHKKHKDTVLGSYIPHFLKVSEELTQGKKILKLFTLKSMLDHSWKSVNLDHPSTFDTLAMEKDMKKMIMDDLDRFLRRKEFYRRVGKAWKRGYLLYGPPGTGKSSLIAAMANYLNFNVYDLELSSVQGNKEFRQMLISTENKSILVIEDIDCCIELEDRRAKARATANIKPDWSYEQSNKITLSGLLNFIDGLWSSCGDERIIIVTTNHKERLDPALLRPGRMDVHIHMSYCTPCGFKMLASNYLGLTEHPLFSRVEELIKEATVTPADVAEQLLRTEEPDIALSCLIEFLETKKKENNDSSSRLEEEAKEGEVVEEAKNIKQHDGETNKGTSQDMVTMARSLR